MSNKQCLFGNDGHQTRPLSFSHHHLSFPPPPTMLVTAANNTCHHHHPSWLPTNTNDHQWLQHHHHRPKSEDSCPQMTTNAHPMNDGLDPQMDLGSDKPRWVNLPLLALHFVHTEYRCHIAVSDMAAKQRMTMLATSLFIVVLNLGHHSEYPLSHVHPNSPHWDTGWQQPSTMTWHGHKMTTRTQDEDVAKTGGNNEDMWQQWHTVTMIHNDNDAWWQWCTVMTIHGNKVTTTLSLSHHPYPPTFNIPIPLTSPSPLPLTSPSL